MTTVFTNSLTANTTGFSGLAVRAACLVTGGGTALRITFVAPTSGNNFKVDHVSVMVMGGSTAPSAAGAPVEVLFSGAHGFNLAPGATLVSDLTSLTFVNGDTLIVDYDCNAGVSVDVRIPNLTSPTGNQSTWFKAATADYNNSSVSGYTQTGYVAVSISSIDTASALTLTPATGSYVLTGVAARLGKGYTLVTTAGAYVLTGVGVAMKIARKISPATGSYTLTGVGITFKRAVKMSVAAGAYVLTGTALVLKVARKLIPATGVYVVTGVALIVARLVAPANKFKRRIVQPILYKLRQVLPTLGE